MTDILIIVSLTLLCVYAGWLLHRWHIQARTVEEVTADGPTCGICHEFLPPDTYRRHDGHWRCRRHKTT